MDLTRDSSNYVKAVTTNDAQPSLLKRREIKFLLPSAGVGSIRRVLTDNCQRLVFNRKVSQVRSIYFDDFRFSGFHENLDGIGRREKLRIRWYDQKMPGSKFFVEIKWRNNLLTGKHRIQVTPGRPLGDLTYRELSQMLDLSLPDNYQRMLLTRGDPVVIVEYKREHFVSPNQKIRLTLDYDMVFYDQTFRRAPHVRFGIPQVDAMVLEAKLLPEDESQLKALLYPLSLAPTRCSKYSLACQRLDFA